MPRSKRTKNTTKRKRDEVKALVPTRVDNRGRHQQRSIRLNNIFDNFRRDIEGVMNPWSSMLDWRFPREFGMLSPYRREEDEGLLSRTPLVDMVDKGDRYHLRLEIPGIDKDKIQLNATEDSIEISGEQSEEESGEERGRDYIYNERSYNSFYRNIPIPEEIVPSKISAKMQHGILQVEIPKKESSRPVIGSTRIQIE
jgi:HSP20 family protein